MAARATPGRCGVDGAVGGTDRGDDLALGEPSVTGGRGQHIQRIRGGEPVLREAARGPEQATVPLTFTTGGDPRRQPGHVHIGVPIHTARRRTARCGVGVEEVPQPLRV